MTRRDYILIAQVLKSQKPHPNTGLVGEWRACVRAFADALANENPRFQRDRFLDACDVASGTKRRAW
jgi:hypothetical protein